MGASRQTVYLSFRLGSSRYDDHDYDDIGRKSSDRLSLASA